MSIKRDEEFQGPPFFVVSSRLTRLAIDSFAEKVSLSPLHLPQFDAIAVGELRLHFGAHFLF